MSILIGLSPPSIATFGVQPMNNSGTESAITAELDIRCRFSFTLVLTRSDTQGRSKIGVQRFFHTVISNGEIDWRFDALPTAAGDAAHDLQPVGHPFEFEDDQIVMKVLQCGYELPFLPAQARVALGHRLRQVVHLLAEVDVAGAVRCDPPRADRDPRPIDLNRQITRNRAHTACAPAADEL